MQNETIPILLAAVLMPIMILHKYKNKFVVYTGERVLDSDLWKTMIISGAEKYLIEEKRTKVEGIFKDLIEKEQTFDQIIIFTAKETHWLGLVGGKFEAHALNENTVWTTGSGQGFARAAWATGIAEKNIVPLVGSIDTATSQSYDLFYRKHLR